MKKAPPPPPAPEICRKPAGAAEKTSHVDRIDLVLAAIALGERGTPKQARRGLKALHTILNEINQC